MSSKLDRSFVKNSMDPHAAAVIKSMVELAHNLGMLVVAEGIETAAQANFLESISCDMGQGYYFSRPLAETAAEHFANHPKQRPHLSRDEWTRSEDDCCTDDSATSFPAQEKAALQV